MFTWEAFDLTRRYVRDLPTGHPSRLKYNELCVNFGICAWCANIATRRLTKAAYLIHCCSYTRLEPDVSTGELVKVAIPTAYWDNALCVEHAARARVEYPDWGAETFVPTEVASTFWRLMDHPIDWEPHVEG